METKMNWTHAVTEPTATPCRQAGAFAPEQPASPLVAWLRDVRAVFRRRSDVAQLRRLTDRELQDIGMDRSEILSAVYGPSADERRRFYVGP
jgi:uncharacterized protein YjiS (DUF1127 family)